MYVKPIYFVILYVILKFIIYLFESGSHYIAAVTGKLLYRVCWPWTYRNSAASASQVLGCATTPGSHTEFFFEILGFEISRLLIPNFLVFWRFLLHCFYWLCKGSPGLFYEGALLILVSLKYLAFFSNKKKWIGKLYYVVFYFHSFPNHSSHLLLAFMSQKESFSPCLCGQKCPLFRF